MGIKSYITAMIMGTLVSLTALCLTLIFINPENANTFSLALFYTSLFLSILGIFSLFGLLMRNLIFKHEIAIHKAKISLRQSFWFASLATIAMVLQSFRLLKWWNILLLLGAFLIFEFLFLVDDPNYQVQERKKNDVDRDGPEKR
ncbi:MAG TPA: hypothetical protein VJA22_02935 [Patescibacteria group bacterium]|nr:hypothetical protein [Patescibacteria group bacterium]